MARSCPPWLWAKLLLEFGPKNSVLRLVLLGLRAFTDDSGYTFVGQAALASACALSRPTIVKMLAIARREKWIGVTCQQSGGQAWRRYEYRCCIPDHITVEKRKWLDMLDAHGAKYGPVNTDDVVNGVDHVDTPEVVNPVDHVDPQEVVNGVDHVGVENAERHAKRAVKGGKPALHKVVNATSEGGKPDAKKVVNGVNTKCISEKFPISVLSEEGAFASESTIGERPKRISKKSAPRHSTTPQPRATERMPAPTPKPQPAKPIETAQQRRDRAKKAIQGLPDFSDGELAKAARCSVEEIREARSAVTGSP